MTNTQSPAPGVAAEAIELLAKSIGAGFYKNREDLSDYSVTFTRESLEKFCTALQASAAAVEPVAWMADDGDYFTPNAHEKHGYGSIPLYTAPPLPAQVPQTLGERVQAQLDAEDKINWRELVAWWESPNQQWDGLKDVVTRMIASRTPAPGMAGGVGASFPKLKGSPFEHFFAQALHAAWIDGWGCCRDAEYSGDEAMNDAFNQSATITLCLNVEHPAAPHPSPAPQAAGADSPADKCATCGGCGMREELPYTPCLDCNGTGRAGS